jgi:hypothetical protein
MPQHQFRHVMSAGPCVDDEQMDLRLRRLHVSAAVNRVRHLRLVEPMGAAGGATEPAVLALCSSSWRPAA